jgi:hypothetical protein
MGEGLTGEGQRVFEDTGTGSGWVTGAERSGMGGRPRTDGTPTAHDSGTGAGAGTADPPQRDGHSKTAKNPDSTERVTPPPRIAGRFRMTGSSAYGLHNPNTENI